MRQARNRLAAQAAAAGYPTGLLTAVAEATLPRHQAGEPLDDDQIEQITSAVETLAQAGHTAEQVAELVAHYQRRHGDAWRERFWAQTMRTANLRYAQPELYGLSPCETDPARLAQHGPPPAAPGPGARPSKETLMTDLAAARTDAPAPVTGPPTAAELAARIPVPTRLPVRYDGQPMRHLSNSSYTKFLLCPEDFRRHYIKGERTPPSGAMFLGGRVDDALTAYYRRILEHGDTLALDQVKDAYRDQWARQLDAEQAKRGVGWEPELTEAEAFEIGLAALETTFAELVPRIGRPVAVQRKLEFALTPGLEWTIQCYLDLETMREDPDTGEVAPAIVDYKVKGSLISQEKANHDPQAGLYLAGSWLEGHPARDFSFAQIAKPGRKRKQMNASFVTTTRTPGQLRGSLARIAQAASQIAAFYERFGPDQPWGFADPTGWKCAPRYCAHHAACPGGAGL
jgi:PD-(D/E)XK nuclease superfamily